MILLSGGDPFFPVFPQIDLLESSDIGLFPPLVCSRDFFTLRRVRGAFFPLPRQILFDSVATPLRGRTRDLLQGHSFSFLRLPLRSLRRNNPPPPPFAKNQLFEARKLPFFHSTVRIAWSRDERFIPVSE